MIKILTPVIACLFLAGMTGCGERGHGHAHAEKACATCGKDGKCCGTDGKCCKKAKAEKKCPEGCTKPCCAKAGAEKAAPAKAEAK